jgi:hypothetical protein
MKPQFQKIWLVLGCVLIVGFVGLYSKNLLFYPVTREGLTDSENRKSLMETAKEASDNATKIAGINLMEKTGLFNQATATSNISKTAAAAVIDVQQACDLADKVIKSPNDLFKKQAAKVALEKATKSVDLIDTRIPTTEQPLTPLEQPISDTIFNLKKVLQKLQIPPQS